MNFLDSLNEPQRNGVTNTEGPTMIIAGAGSGKTRVLTYRIAYLIKEKNVDPFNILALTFTNKAAKEMRDRIEGVVGTEARNLWMGTFHSIFARILRAEAGKIGYQSNFTIYDTDDSKSLIKNILKELKLDDKVYKPGMVLNRISSAKNRLISWREYNDNPMIRAEDESAAKPHMGKIYKTYVQRCFKSDAMDFDDLLFNTNVLFREHPDVLNKYQHRFHYVLVDEFQDTNFSQYLITKKLAAVRRNICVVGDDAQSIYAFRGADIQNILNFEKDFSDLNVFKLEQNYRSTKNIIEAANSVISKNKAQLKKHIWTTNEEGTLVEMIKATSDQEEGRLVAYSIFEQKNNDHARYSDFAILYRTNSQSRAMEEALRKRNIKYKIIGGLSFYQRKEIKDIIAYMRFVVNQSDEQAFRRIVNLPKRGIGATTIDKVMVTAYEQDLSIWEVLNSAHKFFNGRTANALSAFKDMMKGFMLEAEKKDAFDAASHIAKGSGLLRELYEDKTIEGLNRYENVQELLNAIKEFVDNPEAEDKSMGAFLQEVALLTSVDQSEDDEEDRVTMMTIHMAKGLEFPYIYVVGMEEDLFPSQMMLSSRTDLEEERRLFYVAITRSMKKLVLSYALSRYRFGRLKNCEPSRFLEEIDPAYVMVNKAMGSRSVVGDTEHARVLLKSVQRDRSRKAMPHNTRSSYKPSPDFAPSDTSHLEAGMKVEHPKFGFGVVKNLDVEGANRKAKVEFDDFGEKTLLLSFAKLKIHDE
ncbi:DNA helicase-2/ATP-dependent DNA helicase PcrA [Catalinimonas alkaloidigena]|uniref:ATP-dependent helicase n=1 Tax=Catalinimonas alkaloidigena TaxID=1075417 RepID=UPI0024069403|nr:UvrD-helicase domain-containing protein [Catalinimonas alkaloidigena]MDF9801051.1 DNA helicase-2/ATP-dependent DNA helicase PcrA [Catalinimonas alkaloidigena]